MISKTALLVTATQSSGVSGTFKGEEADHQGLSHHDEDGEEHEDDHHDDDEEDFDEEDDD